MEKDTIKTKESQLTPVNEEVAIEPLKDEAERLIELAITKKADVETMQKLMEMRREFKAEKAKEAYDKAMADFQSECPTIEKKKQGYNYKYAPLETIVEQVKPFLTKYGFSYTFDTDEADNAIIVYCHIKHVAGHMETSKAKIERESTSKMNASQQSGSSMTYGKRYAFVNGFGIVVKDEDNDAATPKKESMTPRQMAEEKEEQEEFELDTSSAVKAWCKNHPKSFIGKDQHGNWYKKCVQGNRTNEECEIVFE